MAVACTESSSDQAWLNRITGVTVDYTPGDRPGGRAGATLGASLLNDLTRLALSVEQGFGAPVDIEAAASGGAWYLLQARPITTA